MNEPSIPTRSDEDAVFSALKRARLFRGVSPELVARFARHSQFESYRLGERVWRRGDVARHFTIVQRGVLELRRAGVNSEITLVALFGPGETPAVPVALETAPYIADAHASTAQLELVRVLAAPVLEAMKTECPVACAMNRALLEHVRLLHHKVDVVTAGAVPQRLGAFFVGLVDRFGDERESGTHFVPLALSRRQIALYVAARVETVIRCLTRWEKNGWLRTDREGFEIADLQAIRLIVEGAKT